MSRYLNGILDEVFDKTMEGVGEKEQKRRSEASGAYLQACPREEGSRGGYGLDAQGQARWGEWLNGV